jgi:hypothetical protein
MNQIWSEMYCNNDLDCLMKKYLNDFIIMFQCLFSLTHERTLLQWAHVNSTGFNGLLWLSCRPRLDRHKDQAVYGRIKAVGTLVKKGTRKEAKPSKKWREKLSNKGISTKVCSSFSKYQRVPVANEACSPKGTSFFLTVFFVVTSCVCKLQFCIQPFK